MIRRSAMLTTLEELSARLMGEQAKLNRLRSYQEKLSKTAAILLSAAKLSRTKHLHPEINRLGV
jgi:hypothetical protein